MRLLTVIATSVLILASASMAQTATETAAPDDLVAQGEALVAKIVSQVTALKADSPHPLFTGHLRSTEALVRDDWARAKLTADSDAKYLKRTVEYLQKITDGLDGDAGKWDSYACGRRGLVYAFVSWYDQSLQQYQLRLPRDWDPQKAYPLLVYLHGHVPSPHPLWYTALSFGPGGKPKAADEAKKADELEPHFTLAPWGRGNTGYRDAGEVDVWETLDATRADFKIDSDRMYLTGHSMGGFGTWTIGLRTPDLWAALAIYAGADRGAPAGSGLAGNAAYVPVALWHGVKDKSVPVQCAYEMRDEMLKYKGEVKIVIDEDAGHMVPRPAKKPINKWLFQQKRTRPDRFSYIADTKMHPGVWGVQMRRDPLATTNPRFVCSIEGSTVAIDSQDTEGLSVNLGEGGLGLTGTVTVLWNGEKAYEGPVETIKLGEGVGRNRYARSRSRR